MAHTEDGFMRLRELCTEKSWWRVPHLIKLNLLLLVPFLTSYVGGFDGSMLNGIQTVPKWQEDFNHPHGSLLGLMVNMQVIGGVVSLPLAPFAADKYGRRHPIFLGAVIIILGALVQGCAKNFGMFIAGRFFVGLGGGFVATAAPPLLGELAYPTHRPVITAIYNTTWFFRTKGNRHRLFIVAILGFIIQWCGNQLISSYLALVLDSVGITNPSTQNLVNGALQIYNFAAACSSATLIDRLGRRFMLLTSTIGMLIAFVIWTALAAQNQQQGSGNKGLGIGVVVMVFVFYTFYNFAMNPLPIAYLVEVLPYTLRAKGLTVFNLAQYCSGIFNGFVNPVALDAVGWKYYIVFICALALWLIIIYFTFPETRGMTLEEVSEIFDGRQVLERTYEIKAEGLGEIEHTEEVIQGSKEIEVMNA
ncbi:hypothetical protein PoHVEF18_008569 [Penicillium ochrochloron]